MSLIIADLRETVMIDGTTGDTDMADILEKIHRGVIIKYVHLRNADLAGTAINDKWKAFIKQQNVKNFDKIIWVK